MELNTAGDSNLDRKCEGRSENSCLLSSPSYHDRLFELWLRNSEGKIPLTCSQWDQRKSREQEVKKPVFWAILQTPSCMCAWISRQEYWSGLPCLPPGNLPDPGIKPASPEVPALQMDSLSLSHQGSSTVVSFVWNHFSSESFKQYNMYLRGMIVKYLYFTDKAT